MRGNNRMDAARKYIIGIDIGGTNFRIGLVDEAFQVKLFDKIPVTDVFSTEDALGDLTAFLRAYILKNELDGQLRAISIGFPATVNRERTVVMQAPNVAFMENLPVVEHLNRELQIPVCIERDVSMALYFDMERYQVLERELVVGVYFGTGIGNAILINGAMLPGRDGAAGELGHIPVVGYHGACGCGNSGCMENVAGGKFLAKLCREVYTDTHIGDIFVKHGKDQALLDFVDRMAIAVATEINILNPECVLVGGGVIEMDAFPRELLEEKIREHTRKPYPEKTLKLLFAEDTPHKCVIGAAIYASKTY